MGRFVIQRGVIFTTYKLEKYVTFKGDHDLHKSFSDAV